MKIRPSRNKLKLVIVSWPGLFPLEDVAQPCSRSGPRVQFVSSREDTRRRVPFGPGSSRFCSVMEPTISLVTFVIARDISRSDWLEITATSTVVRDGPQTG